MHIAFAASDRAAVDAFHRAGLEAGNEDNGAPRERRYGPPRMAYYCAYLL